MVTILVALVAFGLGVTVGLYLPERGPAKSAPQPGWHWPTFKTPEPEAPKDYPAPISRGALPWRKQRRSLEASHNIAHQQAAGFSPNRGKK